MEIIDKQATIDWCKKRNILLSSSNKIQVSFNNKKCIKVDLLIYPLRIIYLALVLTDLLNKENDKDNFEGGLICITQTDIVGPPIETIGLTVINRLRGVDEIKTLEKFPGNLFTNEESLNTTIFFYNTMIFAWDSFWLPESGEYFVFKSHDDNIYIFSKDPGNLKNIISILQQEKFDITEIDIPDYLLRK
jgi:hypothetical protein